MPTTVHEDRVTLIFPPLIETNFGSFYPSTAVLAAFLEAHGIGSAQEDLNEEFALHLLREDMLHRLRAGRIPGAPEGSPAAAAARWAASNIHRLVDEQGRHRFTGGNGYMLGLLVNPFQVDRGDEVLEAVRADRHPLDVFEQFYRESNIVERIPANTLLIGISIPMGPQLELSLLLAAMLKRELPDIPVVLGGGTLSLMSPPDLEILLANHTAVDCVVRFDGEYPLLELARRACAGRFSPAGIAGVSYRDGDRVRHEPPAPGPDINTLPVPAYPKAALDRVVGTTLGVTQARGCYWGKCDYCDFVELYDGSPPFRGRRPDNFVDEIEALVEETGVRRFRFITESIPPAFARRMSQLLIEREVLIAWNSFAMVDRRFDKDLLRLMVRAGCEFLTVGMETTNTRVLNLVHKSADREENLRFLREAKDAGMKLTVNLIPDLPSTTYRESLDTLREVRELADCIDSVSVFPFEPTRSSNVGRDPERFGLIGTGSLDTKGQAQFGLNHFDCVDPAMTSEERADVHRRYRAFAKEISQQRLPKSLLVSLLWSY